MEILMLFPPQWTPVAPSIGIPILNAQLQKAGYKTKVCDLNIDFFNDILNKAYLEQALKESLEQFSLLENEIKNYNIQKISEYPIEVQSQLYKYDAIKTYIEKRLKVSSTVINSIQEALNIFKNKKDFYDIDKFLRAQKISKLALEIAMLPYSPSRIFFDRYENPLLKLKYENIKFLCQEKSSNIFLDYYPEKIKNLITKDTKCVTISINSETQIIPGLTLGYLIKKQYNVHISVGGDYFRRIIDTVEKHPELFELFFDSILIEDADQSIVELAKFIDNKRKIEDISGIVYRNNSNSVIVNLPEPAPPLDDTENMIFDGFDFSKYYTPEMVLPIKSNRHCSWNKCVFCDLYFGQQYNEKSPTKLISEMKEIQNKYGVKHFEFIDSAVSAKYYEQMADIILKEGLNLKYFSFARLEKGFTKEILEKSSKAGLKMLMWGLESGSERIIKLMNKGVDFNNRMNVLKNANTSGIWNLVFTMLGFPTETKEEALKTINLVTNNLDIMHPIPPSTFLVKKHAQIRGNAEEFGIKKIKESEEDFSQECKFEHNGLNKEELDELVNEYEKIYTEKIGKQIPLWHIIDHSEHFFLYLTHYGIDKIKKFTQ